MKIRLAEMRAELEISAEIENQIYKNRTPAEFKTMRETLKVKIIQNTRQAGSNATFN